MFTPSIPLAVKKALILSLLIGVSGCKSGKSSKAAQVRRSGAQTQSTNQNQLPAADGTSTQQTEAQNREAEQQRQEAQRKIDEAKKAEAQRKADQQRSQDQEIEGAAGSIAAQKAEEEKAAAEKVLAEKAEQEKKAVADKAEQEKKAVADKAEQEKKVAAEKAEQVKKAAADKMAAERAEAQRKAQESGMANKAAENKEAKSAEQKAGGEASQSAQIIKGQMDVKADDQKVLKSQICTLDIENSDAGTMFVVDVGGLKSQIDLDPSWLDQKKLFNKEALNATQGKAILVIKREAPIQFILYGLKHNDAQKTGMIQRRIISINDSNVKSDDTEIKNYVEKNIEKMNNDASFTGLSMRVETLAVTVDSTESKALGYTFASQEFENGSFVAPQAEGQAPGAKYKNRLAVLCQGEAQ